MNIAHSLGFKVETKLAEPLNLIWTLRACFATPSRTVYALSDPDLLNPYTTTPDFFKQQFLCIIFIIEGWWGLFGRSGGFCQFDLSACLFSQLEN